MMNDLLVIGNGISRLDHAEEIAAWKGEVWCCNGAYREFGKRATRIATDSAEMVKELQRYREDNKLDFTIWGWVTKVKGIVDNIFTPLYRTLSPPSGQMLVAQALEEGYHNITVAGFDFGGPDVYNPDMPKQPQWPLKMRRIIDHYQAAGKISFIGRDWMPYLMSLDKNGKPIGGEEVVKVKFLRNGYVTEMNKKIAEAYVKKGRVEIVKPEKAEDKKAEAKKAEK